MIQDFSVATLEAERKCSNAFKTLRENFISKRPRLAKLSIQDEASKFLFQKYRSKDSLSWIILRTLLEAVYLQNKERYQERQRHLSRNYWFNQKRSEEQTQEVRDAVQKVIQSRGEGWRAPGWKTIAKKNKYYLTCYRRRYSKGICTPFGGGNNCVLKTKQIFIKNQSISPLGKVTPE